MPLKKHTLAYRYHHLIPQAYAHMMSDMWRDAWNERVNVRRRVNCTWKEYKRRLKKEK